MSAVTGRTLAAFPWRKSSKESLKTLMWSPDERVCLRLVQTPATQANYIDVYRDGNYEAPAVTIMARFQRKGPTKKDPPIFVDGRFDGFELCPLNPAVPADQSPHYLFAWQNADLMGDEDSNGTVFVYDLRGSNFERSKFMI